ncbi:hypothetical protein K439DRAFT_492138 [Ramaria rubella]|nr:hypothetical protein K439DRAFT_492138 [Ramaria rubella]
MHEIQSPTSSSKRSRKPSCCADCDTVKRKQMDGATVQFRAPFEHVFTQRIPLCNPEGRCPTAHMREFIAMSNGNNSRMLAAMRAGASTTIPAMPPSPTNAEPPTSPRDKSDETRSPAPSLRYTSSRACYLSPSVPPTAGVKDYAHHDRPTSLVFDDEDYEDNEDTPRPKSRIIRYR